MTRWLNRFQPWGVTLMRVVLGVALLVHGYPKVIPSAGFHAHSASAALEHYAHYIGSLGLPPWLGFVSALTEFLGGIFLVFGLLTRFVAFLAAIDLLVAIAVVDIHKGYSGSQYPLALAVIAFTILLAGPGAAALDRKIRLS